MTIRDLTAPKPATTGIPSVDAVLPTLRVLGPKGFILAFNMSLRGPQYFHSEYPKAWQHEYESKNYTWADPVLFWAVMFAGDRRWSEITNLDPLGVMTAARRFGLTYGAVFSRWVGTKKSVMTLAREDREFTVEEVALLGSIFDRLVTEVKLSSSLSQAEIDTLRCIRDGMTHKEVAEALNISPSTVKVRIEKARTKLGAASSAQALAMAIQQNLL